MVVVWSFQQRKFYRFSVGFSSITEINKTNNMQRF